MKKSYIFLLGIVLSLTTVPLFAFAQGPVITAPAPGSTVTQGNTYNVTWTGSDAGVSSYSVYLIGGSLGNTGSLFLGVANASQQSFSWTVPTSVSVGSGYNISLSGAGATGNTPTTSTAFSIAAAPIIPVTPPNQNPTNNQNTQNLIAQLRAQIQSLLQQLAQLQAQQGATPAWCHTFNSNLGYNSTGADVLALQTVLTKEGFNVSGDASGTYNDVTASAVSGFQEKYASTILSPKGLTHGTGYVGPSTRVKLNALYGCGQ